MAVNPEYANHQFLESQKQRKMIQFSCLRLSFIITLSSAIGFGAAALVFYITNPSCSYNACNPENIITQFSTAAIADYDLVWTTSTASTPVVTASMTSQMEDKIENQFSFQKSFELKRSISARPYWPTRSALKF